MKALLFALPALLLAACATYGQRLDALAVGATRGQVLDAMEGCPSSTQKAGKYEAFVYANRMPHFFQWSPATYSFILKDGVLVEFGEGDVRQQGVGDDATLTLVKPATTASAGAQQADAAHMCGTA
ncbi:MAG TPA: hypothetical protein VFV70_01075 [Hyphomonadaceae bacterium]|nr:hypothetical protein [Hyphomonadaceae bacterium]